MEIDEGGYALSVLSILVSFKIHGLVLTDPVLSPVLTAQNATATIKSRAAQFPPTEPSPSSSPA